MNTLYTINEIKKMLESGKKLTLAGDEKILSQLPKGSWTGGTIPYFMADKGGEMNREKIFANELPAFVKRVSFKTYNEKSISAIYGDIPENGFAIIIIPSSSAIHLSFALNAPNYKGFASRPLIGWISGVHVDDIGKQKAKVFFGESAKVLENEAVVMHVGLPENKYSEINIVNIFKQGNGDTITFDSDSFSAADANINGKKSNFFEYIKSRKLDTRFPLVANYNGAMINISFQGVDEKEKKVSFYAPVFKGVEYKHAAPVTDYVSEFRNHMPAGNINTIFFSCNCILNYLYSELEGKTTGGVVGPITFGEIAYQLLNQTMAYITITDVN